MEISRRPLLGGLAASLGGALVQSAARAAVGRVSGTPTTFDLSDLPTYRPERTVSGTIRFVGTPFRGAVEQWQKAFGKYQPGVRFENALPSSDVAMASLLMDMADIAPCGREASLEEILGFSEKYLYDPTSVVVASGAADTPGGASWSPVIFVSMQNPLARLTMEQLDGIFGEARTGGYHLNSAVWTNEAARGADRNIRTWGQLGLTGEWADRPIQTYGYAPTGMRSFFELRVFGGGKKWNPNYLEYVDTGTKMVPPGAPLGSHDMLLALASDKFGIGWSGNGHARSVPGLKALPLAAQGSGPYFPPTAEHMQKRNYPLTRDVFMHINRKPGEPLDPKVREFLRFVLSREAQLLLSGSGNQIPLNAGMVIEQRKLLD